MKRSRLKRKKPLRQVNPERLARRRAESFGPQAELCRRLPCCACGRKATCDPAHVRSRAAGGKDSDCVPLCRECHTEQHTIGILTFQQRHSVDLAAVARSLSERLRNAR